MAEKQSPSKSLNSDVEYETLENSGDQDMCLYPVDKNYHEDTEFLCLLRDAEAAIEDGVSPELIKEGSSGAYFIFTKEGVSYFSQTVFFDNHI